MNSPPNDRCDATPGRGDRDDHQSAAELLPLVYDELRKRSAVRSAYENPIELTRPAADSPKPDIRLYLSRGSSIAGIRLGTIERQNKLHARRSGTPTLVAPGEKTGERNEQYARRARV